MRGWRDVLDAEVEAAGDLARARLCDGAAVVHDDEHHEKGDEAEQSDGEGGASPPRDREREAASRIVACLAHCEPVKIQSTTAVAAASAVATGHLRTKRSVVV